MDWPKQKIVAANILVLPGVQFLNQVWHLLDHEDFESCFEFVFPKPQTALSASGRHGVLKQILSQKHAVRIHGFWEIRTRSYALAVMVSLLNVAVEFGIRKCQLPQRPRVLGQPAGTKVRHHKLTIVDLVAWLEEDAFVKERTKTYLVDTPILSTFHSFDLMPHCLPLLRLGRPTWTGPVTFLATSKADELGYELFQRREFDQIIVTGPPGLAKGDGLHTISKDERSYVLLLLQSRSPRFLGIGPSRSSQQDLIQVAKNLSIKLDKRILIRPHPSMSMWELRTELLFSGLRSGFTISRSIDADEISVSQIAITDFSGLTPECVAGGCPVLEVRLSFRASRLADFGRNRATTQVEYDYDYYFNRGLCSRLTDMSSIDGVVTRMLLEEDMAKRRQHLNDWLSSPFSLDQPRR